MKRMLVCVLAPFGLAPLLAQDAPPPPVPQEPPPVPDAVPAPDAVPVTNALPATNIVASTTVAASTNAVASTNVVVAIPTDIPATNAVITADASRSMTADEERIARDILRGIKVEPGPRVPDPKDYFDSTYIVLPIVGDKVYEIVRGNSNPSQHPFVKSSGESTNSTEVASTEKPKRKGKKKQKEIAASSPTVAPEAAATPDVAGNFAPTGYEPSSTPVSDEELRRKEIERIEAEVIKAAEERKLREGGTAGETVPGGANFTPAQPAATEATPATPAATNATPAKPMTAEQEAKTRAILETKSAEVFSPTNPAQTGLAPTPVNAREAKVDQREAARQRAFTEAQRVKEERARVADTATPTPTPDQPATPPTSETPATVDPAAVAPTAPVAPPEGQLPPDVEAKARALLEKAMAETNAPATTVTAPTTLPTEKELKAQAKARRASEKAAAEEAKKQLEAQADAEKKAKAAAKAEQSRIEKEAKKAKAEADKRAKEEARRAKEAEAKARAEAKKNASNVTAAPTTQVETKPAAKTGEAVVRSWENAAGKTKEQRLAELMDAYARDLISASEYHKARASIVNE